MREPGKHQNFIIYGKLIQFYLFIVTAISDWNIADMMWNIYEQF